jgi:hypothetical protein
MMFPNRDDVSQGVTCLQPCQPTGGDTATKLSMHHALGVAQLKVGAAQLTLGVSPVE